MQTSSSHSRNGLSSSLAARRVVPSSDPFCPPGKPAAEFQTATILRAARIHPSVPMRFLIIIGSGDGKYDVIMAGVREAVLDDAERAAVPPPPGNPPIDLHPARPAGMYVGDREISRPDGRAEFAPIERYGDSSVRPRARRIWRDGGGAASTTVGPDCLSHHIDA